jgi:hypothetical protein
MTSADELFERGVSALRLELATQGCPDVVIEKAVADLRADYAKTVGWLRTVEASVTRRNPFGVFRPVQFRRELRQSGFPPHG